MSGLTQQEGQATAAARAAQHALGSAESAAGCSSAYQPGRAGTGAGQLVIDKAATQALYVGPGDVLRCSSQRALT